MINKYLRHLESELEGSPYVDILTILKREIGVAWGHIRLKGILINGDIFEISEYIRIVRNNVEVVRYNYHWQDSSNQLIRRWDNAKHHIHIQTFPHHVHIGTEGNIHESEGMDVERFLKQIEQIL